MGGIEECAVAHLFHRFRESDFFHRGAGVSPCAEGAQFLEFGKCGVAHLCGDKSLAADERQLCGIAPAECGEALATSERSIADSRNAAAEFHVGERCVGKKRLCAYVPSLNGGTGQLLATRKRSFTDFGDGGRQRQRGETCGAERIAADAVERGWKLNLCDALTSCECRIADDSHTRGEHHAGERFTEE